MQHTQQHPLPSPPTSSILLDRLWNRSVELLRQGQRPFGWASQIPLHENYAGKSLKRIQQDVYDRFFTRIEQRFSRKEIATLSDTYREIRFSEGPPYWHFYCKR